MKILFLLPFFFLSSLFSENINLNENETNYLKNKKTITMCVDPDWEPFEKINRNGIHEGISADIIKLISDKLGIKVILINTKTWDDSIAFSKEKKCDILSFLNETSKRKEWLVFTEPIFTDSNVLVGRSEKKYIEDISKENISIALPRETAISERFAKDFPNLTIIPTNTEDEAFKLVEEQKDVDSIVNKYVTIIIEKTNTFTIALWIFGILVIVIFFILLWNYMLNKKVKNEIKKNEEQQLILIQQKRKAEIGELLGNISHQWKNGLSQISSLNLEMMLIYELKENLSNNKEFYQRLKETENSIKFMVETMNTFLGYYKIDTDYSTFEIKENIKQVLKLIDIEIKNSKISIKLIDNFSLHVTANKNEWMHIWLNLITNSIKAAKFQHIKNPQITITINNDEIIFIDNCKGFKNEILKNILNNKQKGLGLKMSFEILKKSNWIMLIENSQNGAKFNIINNKKIKK